MNNINKLEAELECLDVFDNAEGINSMDQGWTKVTVTADSGAAEHVMNKDSVPGVATTPSQSNVE